MNILGNRLKELRKKRELTQVEIATKLNITRRGYQKIESGEQTTKYTTLIAIADFYDVSIDYLVGRTENKDSHKL
ncbi:helix-turn-helix domain-containing protein [Peptostreptococcus anaerobius]|uniref:helix-turn-helix domain-containing protein n=1 Tax=Peptostreptococcus anaerobius TaxID=1261 RepID=UPI001D05FAE3|nr:helix-turn-helix transcriptional regulator [Peptostreptococcus anaerobius]MCB6983798.1 helix-turn-helix domain-containing protein [Peptostreptococcus anaerobius]MCQ5151647.1 helix-turn-helix domain-containing protein [Peptostreptococcus anaerobius]MDB8850762.1 helix-turn-helix transcriptional regulator [Peptostreptococcus anaerobius]MDB8854439.1 helix-turn-helix transcriptional regulator [Peptostreptococcus anaerobius]MDB8856350.1 helix-turn-helix transcriptional regulator [Peptostreptococc